MGNVKPNRLSEKSTIGKFLSGSVDGALYFHHSWGDADHNKLSVVNWCIRSSVRCFPPSVSDTQWWHSHLEKKLWFAGRVLALTLLVLGALLVIGGGGLAFQSGS